MKQAFGMGPCHHWVTERDSDDDDDEKENRDIYIEAYLFYMQWDQKMFLQERKLEDI